MSIESYILGLQKNPSPGKIGKIVLGGLELLAGVYEKGVVKNMRRLGEMPAVCRYLLSVLEILRPVERGKHRVF